MLDVFLQPAFWAGLVLVIGLDMVLSSETMRSVSAMTGGLPAGHRDRIVRISTVLTALFRVVMVFGLVWVIDADRAAFSVAGWSPDWGQVLMVAGGLFLVFKAVTELYALVEPGQGASSSDTTLPDSLMLAVGQTVLVHAVLSVDSIVMAIGLGSSVQAMAIGLIASLAILYFISERVEDFLLANPAVRALAMAFLLMVGALLVARGLGMDVAQSSLYAAMGFAVLVLAAAKLTRIFVSGSFDENAAIVPGRSGEMRQEPSLDAQTTPVGQDRPEPVIVDAWSLEPEIMEPMDPALATDSDEPPIAEDNLVVVDPIDPTPETDIGLAPAIDEFHPEDDFPAEADRESLGEPEGAVQKSRPKRPASQRRPVRLRTGRRKQSG